MTTRTRLGLKSKALNPLVCQAGYWEDVHGNNPKAVLFKAWMFNDLRFHDFFHDLS